MPLGDRLRPKDIVELHPSYLFRWEEAQQAHVLLYPEGIVKLNSSAGEILSLVNGRARVRDIVETQVAKYTGADVAKDTLAFLEIAHDNGWIRVKP